MAQSPKSPGKRMGLSVMIFIMSLLAQKTPSIIPQSGAVEKPYFSGEGERSSGPVFPPEPPGQQEAACRQGGAEQEVRDLGQDQRLSVPGGGSVKIGLVLSPSSHWGSTDPKSAMPPSRKPAARVAAIRTRPRIPISDIRYPETKPYVRQKRAKPLFLGPAEVGAGSVCSSSSR